MVERGQEAELYGRTAVGLLRRHHHWLADASPDGGAGCRRCARG
uniref:Uncharacterized protein n=1 Tax=Nonomuraea gerenzanensis TaxID=93944 RepID=A0A1M4EEC1_9ACTN|nr:hypothetical protein BN4615_P6676 [Nonomuraea gerenzanensis]